MDWSAWRTALLLWMNTPELIVASILILIAVSGFVWWLRGHISTPHIAALNTKVSTMEDSNKLLVAALNERLGMARDEQERVTKQIAVLKEENTKQAYALNVWKSTVPKPQPEVFITDLTAGTTSIGDSITSLSQANTALGETLQGTIIPGGGILGPLFADAEKKNRSK